MSSAISWVGLPSNERAKSAIARCVDPWLSFVGWWCMLNVTVASRWLVRWTIQESWNTSAAAWKCSFPQWLILCHISVVSLSCVVDWFLSVYNDSTTFLISSTVRIWRLERQLVKESRRNKSLVESMVEALVEVRGEVVWLQTILKFAHFCRFRQRIAATNSNNRCRLKLWACGPLPWLCNCCWHYCAFA